MLACTVRKLDICGARREPFRLVKRVDDAIELAVAAERQPSPPPLPVAVNELTQIGLLGTRLR